MKIILYTPEQLDATVTAGSATFTSQGQWVSKMRSTFAGMVGRNPQIYRSFGPFWWPLKRMMVEAGDLDASLPDPDVEEQVSTGSAARNIAAAFMYHDRATDDMTATNTWHTVDTDEGDTIEYLVIDDEMEGRSALSASLS
ncbi:hypothetical protein [Uliginosibacterium sediminicola]|uniref:Uncharacterized protein n=1 Tax=Uliginosibacterium sediminicola TaxID=2024550 RepID=A0ABU9YW36_9RHOO